MGDELKFVLAMTLGIAKVAGGLKCEGVNGECVDCSEEEDA